MSPLLETLSKLFLNMVVLFMELGYVHLLCLITLYDVYKYARFI